MWQHSPSEWVPALEGDKAGDSSPRTFRAAAIGVPALSRNWCEERWVTPQAAPSHGGPRPPTSPGMAPLRGEGPDYSISAESPAQVVPCWIRHLHGNPRLGRCGLGRCHLHGNRCGARMRPGCAGHRVPRREGRVSARPWCGAMEAERPVEQGPALSPARDRLGRAFLSLTFQPQTCLSCPVCPALCQAEPLASVRSGGAQPLSHPREWSSGPFWAGPFPAHGGWRCSGTRKFPDPNEQKYRIPGIRGCSMTAPVLALTS